jgi:restriction system protein
LVDRVDWARSYATLGGALDRPSRALFVLTPLGREILTLPESEALKRVREMDREVRSRRRRERVAPDTEAAAGEEELEEEIADTTWREVLLARLHRLTPDGFEKFVINLLKDFGMELTQVGGTGDEGIDGIGLAPLGPVLFSRVAVQAKRYDPTASLGREVVALFQRDAAAAGAERAVLVTLGRFSPGGSEGRDGFDAHDQLDRRGPSVRAGRGTRDRNPIRDEGGRRLV